MENIRNTFEEDCKIINLKYEYPGYIGEAKFGVITALSEDELEQRYSDQLGEYRPYIVLSPAFGEIRAEFVRNEKKYFMRQQRSESYFGFDENTELLHPEIALPDILTEMISSIDSKEEIKKLYAAMSLLSESEKERIIRHFCLGMTERKIAQLEGKSKNAIHQSLTAGIKKLKDFFKTT